MLRVTDLCHGLWKVVHYEVGLPVAVLLHVAGGHRLLGVGDRGHPRHLPHRPAALHHLGVKNQRRKYTRCITHYNCPVKKVYIIKAFLNGDHIEELVVQLVSMLRF